MANEPTTFPNFATTLAVKLARRLLTFRLPPVVQKTTTSLPAKSVPAIKALTAGAGLLAQLGVPIKIWSYSPISMSQGLISLHLSWLAAMNIGRAKTNAPINSEWKHFVRHGRPPVAATICGRDTFSLLLLFFQLVPVRSI
jgi:hypothetical protein